MAKKLREISRVVSVVDTARLFVGMVATGGVVMVPALHFVMTPLRTQWLAGAYLPVDGWGLFRSMVQVVLIPLIAGLLINTALDRIQQHKRHAVRAAVHVAGPLVSVAVIVLVVGSIVAGNKATIGLAGPKLFCSVFLLHATGFALGYLII